MKRILTAIGSPNASYVSINETICRFYWEGVLFVMFSFSISERG